MCPRALVPMRRSRWQPRVLIIHILKVNWPTRWDRWSPKTPLPMCPDHRVPVCLKVTWTCWWTSALSVENSVSMCRTTSSPWIQTLTITICMPPSFSLDSNLSDLGMALSLDGERCRVTGTVYESWHHQWPQPQPWRTNLELGSNSSLSIVPVLDLTQLDRWSELWMKVITVSHSCSISETLVLSNIVIWNA